MNASILAFVFRPQIYKRTTISGKIVGFFKFVGEIQVRKFDVILHYISLSICPLHFQKFCPIQKQQKMLILKLTLVVYLIIHKLAFFKL